MGQWSGFVARVQESEFDKKVELLQEDYNVKITAYPELCLIVGIIKSDRDGGAFVSLIEAGIDNFRMLGQKDSEADDFPKQADILKDF